MADESELTHIDYGEIINAMNDYREFNIDDFIQSASQPCRLKGMPPEELAGYEDLDILIDLLSHGQRSFMKESFVANGGKRIRQSASYDRAKSQNYTRKAG